MSLTAVNKKLKQLGLKCTSDGEFFRCRQIDDTNTKAFQKWKKDKIEEYNKHQQELFKIYKGNYTIRSAPNDAYWEAEWRYYDDENYLDLSEANSSMCCAVSEFGRFSIDCGTKIDKYWEWFLRYYIAKTKSHYLK